MKNAYHLRENYERILKKLCSEQGELVPKLKNLSDDDLLSEINNRLIKLNCIPMTQEELKQELV